MYDYVCIYVLVCIHTASYSVSSLAHLNGKADAFCPRGLTFGSTSVMHSCKTMLTLTLVIRLGLDKAPISIVSLLKPLLKQGIPRARFAGAVMGEIAAPPET